MGITPTEVTDAPHIEDEPDTASPEVAGRSPWQIAMDQLKHDKVAVACAVVVVLFVLAGVFAPLLCKLFGVSPNSPDSNTLLNITGPDGMPLVGPPNNGFTWQHPLGISPGEAKDNLALWLYGARTSIGIAFFSTVAATIMGVVVGLGGGFARGFASTAISWVIDFFLSLPFILVALSMAPILVSRFADQPHLLSTAQLLSLLIVLSVFGWMPLARLVRGEVLSLREREFIQAARVIGVPTRTILRKELLPNLVAPIIVFFSLSLPAFVAAEAGLAYLGIGVIGIPSWGQTINAASDYFDSYPLFLWAPVIGVLVLVLALNLLGDSIRDAFDPKTRR